MDSAFVSHHDAEKAKVLNDDPQHMAVRHPYCRAAQYRIDAQNKVLKIMEHDFF